MNRQTSLRVSRTSRIEWHLWLHKVREFGRLPTNHGIFTKCNQDQRPYITVSILGLPMKGLLDSGASRTLVGAKGWRLLQYMGLKSDISSIGNVSVADGRPCEVIGKVELPVELEGKQKLLSVLIVPALDMPLVLGLDFWKSMGIVPDLTKGQWNFTDDKSPVKMSGIISPGEALPRHQKTELEKVIDDYFLDVAQGLGCTSRVQHVIETEGHQPIKQRYYPISPIIQRVMDKELKEMLERGVVEPSKSPWSSPVVMVQKKDKQSYRFCVDYRQLNKITKRDAYPLPYVSHILDRLRNAKYLTSLDIKSAYWQVPMEESSREKTAFTVPGRGLFQFRRMPFGLHNSPATWQRLIDEFLGPELEPHVFVYLDDIIVCTSDFPSHLQVLETLFCKLRAANLTLNREKCQFCRSELRYLGYIVDQLGLRVDPEKVSAIVNFPTPTSARQIRQFVGLASWYRRFVPDFSSRLAPLTDLLKKNKKFSWTEQCETAFREVKERLISAPVLTCPDFSRPFILQTDASTTGLGAILSQEFLDGEKVVAYASRTLTKAEGNYSTTEQECLAVIWGVEKFRPYLEGAKFLVITDHHALTWLHNLKDPTGRLSRWALKLQGYAFDVVHRAGKLHTAADALSRNTVASLSVSAEALDPWYREMLRRVTDHPENYPLWRVEVGRLYKYVRDATSLLTGGSWRKVPHKSVRKQVMKANHDDPTAGHLGRFKTYQRIREEYYWPGMFADIGKYVRCCSVCLAHKPQQQAVKGLMGVQRIVTEPWQMICSDIMGPFPPSSQQNRYLLVVSDCFTKYTLLFPMRTVKASAIIKRLEEDIFLVYGTPKWLLNDNGPQYISHSFQQKMRGYGVKILYNPVYHPQANPAERINRVLKTMIASYVKDNHRKWDRYLPQFGYALRTAVHEVTGYSPAFLNFGRQPSVGQCVETREDENNEVPEISLRDNRVEKLGALAKLHQQVFTNLGKAYVRNTKSYNLRRRPASFQEGDVVWRRTHHQSQAHNYFSAKLAPRFTKGTVAKKISPIVYEIKDDVTGTTARWHIKDLKKGPTTEGSDESEEEELM